MATKILAAPLREHMSRQAGRVGTDDSAWSQHLFYLCIEIVLDIQLLYHSFDDPVDIGHFFQVILDVLGHALTATDTQRSYPQPLVRGLQIIDQRGNETRSTTAKRVAKSDGTTVRIELLYVDAHGFDDRQVLSSKCLVQLNDVDIA